MASQFETELQQLLKLLGNVEIKLNELKSSGRGDQDSLRQVNSFEQARNRLLEQRLSLISRINAAQTGAAIPGGHTQQGATTPLPSSLNFAGTDNAKKKLTDAQKFAKEQQEAAQRLAQSNVRYREALLQAEKLHLKIEDLRKIEDRGGGIQQLLFQRQVGGKDINYRTYVNEFGKATPGLSSQFRSFGSDIVRDIGQFTKWSIAVAAVYTPLQKLGELMSIMVDNQSRLADATIAANVPFEKSGQIFDQVYESANKAGEGITITIDAYAQAVRAAGRYQNETTKQTQAIALLNDSLILSKLSTLDQATAIDTLSAALLQSERQLNGGEELLNKWVRVSQLANVDIATLATGVAVLGDSAETAGLSVDQLNGLIAVLSEQSITGSKEAANVAKALIGSYQSDKAEATLNKFGIALRNSSGEVRNFLDIYQQLADLRSQGLLSEANVSELALALGGGGVRRAKDASALINSQDRLNELAAESAKITGESTLAQDSLAKKLETVETANTRLANSFQGLAQTLGDEGGLLETFKDVVNLLTLMTKGADDLFSILGRSGPILATFATGIMALSRISPERRATMLGMLGQPAIQNWGATGMNDIAGIRQQGLKGFGTGVLGDILQMNMRGAGILGGASILASGISNLREGKEENAIANVLGGVIGGAIGATLGGPVGLAAGAAIGSSVGDSFVSSLMAHSTDLKDYFDGIIPLGKEKGGTTTPYGQEVPTEELIKQMYKEIGGGSEFIGGFLAQQLAMNSQAVGTANGARLREQYGGTLTKEGAALELLKERDSLLVSQLQARYEFGAKQTGSFVDPAEVERNRVTMAMLQNMAEQERQVQLNRLVTGEIRPSEYGKITDSLGGFPVSAKQNVEAFGDEFIKISDDIKNTEDAYKAFVEFTVYGTDEQRNQINSYVSDIQRLQAEWENWNPAQKDLTVELSSGTQTFASKSELGQSLAQRQLEAAQFTNFSILEARLQRLNLPNIVGSAIEPTPQKDVDTIRNEAEKLQQQFYSDMSMTNEEIEHLRDSLDKFSVYVEKAGENHYQTISGIDQKFWDAAQKLLEKQNKLAKPKDGFGFQQFDVDRGTLEQLASKSVSIGNTWAKKFPGFETKQEDLLAITNEGIAKPIHADFRILALLLEKIVDQNQKQLDGQYNIPEGATFWVPLTAAYYRNKGGEGGGDLQSMLDSLAVDENTGATESNTQALWNLSEKFNDYFMSEKTMTPYDKNAEGKKIYQESERTYKPILTKHEDRYDYMNQTSRSGSGSSESTIFESLQRELMNLLKNLLPVHDTVGPNSNRYRPRDPLITSGKGTVGGRDMLPQAIPQSSSRLDLRFQSNINLMVDGRAIANVVRTYLASELLRTDSSQGTVTKRFVI